jgi:DNA-binding MarR family transcriptional regulator
MTEKDVMFHIGPNQRQILRILERYPNLTAKEIADKVYQKTVNVGDFEYRAASRSLHGLLEKGLVERTAAEVRWRTVEKKPKSRYGEKITLKVQPPMKVS